MKSLSFNLQHDWSAFTVGGFHLNFEEHRIARLSQVDSSDWGPAIYKNTGASSTSRRETSVCTPWGSISVNSLPIQVAL